MSIVSSASSAPASERFGQQLRGRPARVKTVRPWSASVWRSSSAGAAAEGRLQRASDLRASRPADDVGDGEQASASRSDSSSPPPRIASPSISTVGSSTTQSRWTGTWTVPPIAAEAPKATWAVPRIFSSSRMLPVRIASSLVPIPSSATLVPSGPCARQQLHQRGALVAGRVGQVALRDGQRDRRLDQADAGDRAVDHERALAPVPSTGAMKPSPQGRLPKAPRPREFARVDDRPRAPRAEPQVAAVAAGDPRLGAAVQRVEIAQPRRRISSRSPFISRASISSVTPGSVAMRTPGFARRFARRGVGERLDRRRQHDVGGRHRRGDRGAAARRRGSRARRSPPASRRRRRPAPRSASAPRSLPSPGLQTTSTSSPGSTPMHCRTTVLTALSRSAPGIGPA